MTHTAPARHDGSDEGPSPGDPLNAPTSAAARHATPEGTDSPTLEAAPTVTDRLAGPPERDPILSLTEVTIAYPRAGQPSLAIVTDLTLQLRPGEFVCVAGRSGSGKTSILRVAAGLTAPTGGSVAWNGTDIAGLSADQLAGQRRRLCGVLDQSAALLPELSALENVLLAAVPDRRVKQLRPHAEALLDQLGLAARARHRPEALSGGERQRVGLARAMLLDPPVLIVDEPTASLDRSWADNVITALAAAADRGTAVLAASHDPHLTATAHTAIALD